jgi:hypothetical protein
MTTPDLIAALSANPAPVRRLPPPLLRAGCWLALAGLVMLLLGVSHGLRPDFAGQLGHPAYVVGLAASLLTGIAASCAAFLLSLPDRSRLYVLLPLPSLLAWLATVSAGCLTDWVSIGPQGMHMGEAVSCFATLVLTSLPLSLALLVMLRYTARLGPVAVIWMGSLAIASLTASALSLFHDIDATVLILLWNIGAAALIVGLGRMFGRRALSWVWLQPDRPPS